MNSHAKKRRSAAKARRAAFVRLSNEDVEILRILISEAKHGNAALTLKQIAHRIAEHFPEWRYGENRRILLRQKIISLENAGYVSTEKDYALLVSINGNLADKLDLWFNLTGAIAEEASANRCSAKMADANEGHKTVMRITQPENA